MPHGLRSRGGSAWLALLLSVAALTACATGDTSLLASATPVERGFALAAVTCDEWKQYVAGLFREVDANRDGFLTRQEFAALARSDRLFEVAGFDYFDANSDGRLSLSEMADKPNPAFQLLDKNGDCVISAEERVNQRSYARDDGKSQGAASPSGRRK